ncbi:MAG: Gfo/Idh/MocA family oxidoreductase, partial [Lachnospiraceae bacterium]|nr:Gfo/Idh/MocA family oxidoreductase [Lachnospiraceae bacterium]
IPVLKAGYDLLLEKPFAVNQEEADRLLVCAHETGRKVMICHVLRYAPFYKEMKTLLSNGEIGTVLSIQMAEHVSYFHQSVSYVRGKYASPKLCGSGMLLSKCSHDLDIMAWMLNGIQPEKVSSIGTVSQFKEDMAPEGAGTHCLLDCPVERECIFSAKRLYLENPQRWANNIWHECGCVGIAEEEKEQVLRKPDNPYSQCVYLRNLQIVDHQSMMVSFANGALGTFSMVGGSSASGRRIHITGTKGEIYGTFEDQRYTVSLIDPREAGGKKEYVVDVSSAQKGNAHGGGDQAIVRDFISILNNEKPSLCCTTLDDSMIGHQLVFMAEKSRERGGAWMEVK